MRQTSKFMTRKKNVPGFSQSEAEFLISCMDRHDDWAVILCLVGGGQEINTGEAGIDSWIEAIQSRFALWDMHISSRLTDSEYGSGKILEIVRERECTYFDDSLHLAVSMRSFRAENVSSFVKVLWIAIRQMRKRCSNRSVTATQLHSLAIYDRQSGGFLKAARH